MVKSWKLVYTTVAVNQSGPYFYLSTAQMVSAGFEIDRGLLSEETRVPSDPFSAAVGFICSSEKALGDGRAFGTDT